MKSLVELNGWLEDRCLAHAAQTKHPEFKDRTIAEVFDDERASLMPLRGPFDGFVEKAVRATTTCLIMADHNLLEHEKAAGRTGRLADNLLRYDLIVIDELGYLPFSQPGGQLLFHLISKLEEVIGLDRYAIYNYDDAEPTGIRMAMAHPDRITATAWAPRRGRRPPS